MSFSNIDVLRLGNLTQILFSKGVLYQGSEDTREWEQIQAMRVTDQAARELRFMLQSSLGPAASQYRNPGTSGREFPQAQQASVSEFTAKFKEMNTTLKLEYQLWERALMAKNAKYMEPLALEVQSKAIAQKRVMCFDLYGDGTGVRGTVASVDASAIATGRIVVTLADTDSARGHVGAFEQDDLLVPYTIAGVANTYGVTTPYAWKVVDKDFDAATVTFDLVDSSEAVITTTTTVSTAATDVFYRVGQPTKNINLTSNATVGDYGTASEVLVGLETLAATDGRDVWDITMTGAYKGSVYDAGGDPMDAILFDKAMSRGKRRVGQGRYKYKKACMADETHTQLIDSRETDRRFLQVTDNKRGTTYFGYQHRNDLVECYTSEFVSKHRVWMLPESSGGEKVLEYHGSDWKAVKVPGGSEFHLNASANGGYTNDIVSYMRGIGVLIARHPAAIIGIRNFSLSV